MGWGRCCSRPIPPRSTGSSGSPSRATASASRHSSASTSSTACAPSCPSRSPWPPPGISRRSNEGRRSQPVRPGPSASTGPSLPWSTSPGIPAGAGSSRAPARTHSSARRSQRRRSGASRAGDCAQPDRIIAGPKHFAGYGAALGGRDYDEVNLSDHELWNVIFPPFQAAVEAGAGNVMTAYMDLNGVPAAGQPLAVHRGAPRDLGLRRVRGQRRQRRAQPRHPRAGRRRCGRRRPGPRRGCGHGDGDRGSRLRPPARRARGGRGRRADARRERAADPRGEAAAGPVRRPVRRRGPRPAGAGRPGPP